MSEAKPPTTSISRVDPALLATVVKIESQATLHSAAAIGTGFIVSCEGTWASKQQRLPFLITNKHVVGDWTLADGDILEYRQTIRVSFYGGAGGAFTPITIQLLKPDGSPLPTRLRLAQDPKVDVVAVFLGGVPLPEGPAPRLNSLDTTYLLPFQNITSWATNIGDQVFALGYPLGITSARTSYPIAKVGCLATVPGEVFAIDVPTESRNCTRCSVHLEGKLLVVDGLIVPGNSGGPIVLPSEVKLRIDSATSQFQYLKEMTKNYVIGMVSMGIGQSGLTLAYSSDYLLDLIREFCAELDKGTAQAEAA